MKIVADENIPFVNELFSPFGDVVLSAGRSMNADLLEGADILLVRSVTKVNEALLAKSNVKFVGTCTIGTDHLDKKYLEEQGIVYSSAPGCNANGVVQYVVTALAQLNFLGTHNKVGIVGFGNVGSRVYKMLKALGFDCRCVDPFKTLDDCPDLVSFDEIFDCDIICVHTPFTTDGDHPTEEMFSTAEFERMKPGAFLLNAGRGPVLDNDALLEYLKEHDDIEVVLDVWQEEPDMNSLLFNYVQIGTTHIAGYSYEGRVTGSTMIYEALTEFLNIEPGKRETILNSVKEKAFGEKETIQAKSLRDAVAQVYSIDKDHMDLENALAMLPQSFDLLRKNYHKRREFAHYICESDVGEDRQAMETLGFSFRD